MTPLKKPVSRVAQTPLDGTFCIDRRRRLVVTLIPGDGEDRPDLLELRPERTRRPERIALADVFRFAIRCRVASAQLESLKPRRFHTQGGPITPEQLSDLQIALDAELLKLGARVVDIREATPEEIEDAFKILMSFATKSGAIQKSLTETEIEDLRHG